MTLVQIRQAILLVLAFTLVLASVAYSSLLQRGYVVVKFSAVLVGATALLALSTYLLAMGRRWRELRDPFFYLLAGELGVLLISVAFSGQRWVSLLGSVPRLMGAITIACFLVAAVAVVLGAAGKRERLVFLLRVILLTTAASACIAIYEWPTHHIFRPPGLVGNAEFLSNYLLFGAVGGIALLMVERRTAWAVAAAVATALAGVGVTMLKTRGAWLGLGAGVAILLVLVRPRDIAGAMAQRIRLRLAVLCGASAIIAGVAALWGWATAIQPVEWNFLLPFLAVAAFLAISLPWLLIRLRFVRHSILATLALLVAVTGYSVATQHAILPYKAADALRLTQESARGVVRDDTIRMLGKYWLIGCGIENYRVAFLEFKSERLARADPRVNYRNPHNMLLYEWTANGLLGVLVYLGLLVFAIWSLILARRREPGSRWGLFANVLLATLVAYTVQNLFNYDVIPTGLHYYVFLGMALVLRRTAGQGADPDTADTEAVGSARNDPPEDDTATGRKKTKKGKRGKQASKGSKKAARRVALDAAAQEQSKRWTFISVAVGLGGLLVLLFLLYVLPSVRDLFTFSTSEVLTGKAKEPKEDILRLILIVSWVGVWTVAALSGRLLAHDPTESPEEGARIGRGSTWTLALLLALCVGLGSWWAGRQIKADYAMFRAHALSRQAGSRIIPQIQRLGSAMQSIRRAQQQANRPDLKQRAAYIDRQLRKASESLKQYLGHVQRFGRRGSGLLAMMGYYHFQYSKALHPFLKGRRLLDNYRSLVAESLKHARASVNQNTNPESAWSHLSVVYLASGNLPKAKFALGKSIAHDPFYYDTHRMMALLHLQDGHIGEAQKEIHRSLDITEGKHFHFSQESLMRFLHAMKRGDMEEAQRARRKLWYWLDRGRNFPGMPVQLFRWWRTFEGLEKMKRIAALLAKDTGSTKGQLSARRKRIARLGIGHVDKRILLGIDAVLRGDSRAGRRHLTGFHIRRPPDERPIDRVITIVSSMGYAQQVVARLERMTSPEDDRSRQQIQSLVERAVLRADLYKRIIAHRLATLLEGGQDERAKVLARASAAFLHALYGTLLEARYTRQFRTGFRQVLPAKRQVDEAASPEGLVRRARSFSRRRRYEAALRVISFGEKRYGQKLPEIYALKGEVLERMGRLDEALTAYQTYLKLAPDGPRAGSVKQRMDQLGQ